MVERIGQQLGNYRLVKLLGKGGFAEVYLGEHIYLKNLAAVKILYARMGEADLGIFLREARTLVKLINPHIVRVLDFGVTDNTPFLVMDYAQGGTLRQRFPVGVRVPLQLVVTYVKQVALALQYAHDQKLVHCDIKPENILLDKNNMALLSDFGIATISQSTHYPQLRDQEASGTIGYMAPEQIQSSPRAASDQYALGVVAYEWLCGTRPFRGSFIEVAAKHAMAAPAPLRDYVPELSPAVERVVLTALAKAPEQRFPSVMAFANALEQAAFDSQQRMAHPPLAGETQPAFYPTEPDVQAYAGQVARQVPPTPPLPEAQGREWFASATVPGSPVASGARGSVATSTAAPVRLPPAYLTNQRGRLLLVSLVVFLALILVLGASALALGALKPSGQSGATTTNPAVTTAAIASSSPTPATAVYPTVAGNYVGNVHNSLVNVDANMMIAFQQNRSLLKGQFVVSQPLLGNGVFRGTIDVHGNLQFTVTSADTSAPIHFVGVAQADHSLSGSYCSVNPQGQCDSNYGGYGTWHVFPA